MNSAHERQKMAQAACRFWDALRGYLTAVLQERRPLAHRSIGSSSGAAPGGFPLLRLAAAFLGLSAVLFILKAVQS
jgi:hypothetical protein